jgi:hypothetical protein
LNEINDDDDEMLSLHFSLHQKTYLKWNPYQITLMHNPSRLEDTCINYSIISFFIFTKSGLHSVFCLPLLEVRFLYFSPPALLDAFV